MLLLYATPESSFPLVSWKGWKKKVERLILSFFQWTLLKHFLSYGPQKNSGKEASIKLSLEGPTISKTFLKGNVHSSCVFPNLLKFSLKYTEAS